MAEVEINDKNFDEEIAKEKGVVLVDFWAPWCGPCRMMGPIVEELAKDFEGKAKVAKLNVDESPVTAGKFSVMSIPTLIIFKDGQMVDTLVGVQEKETLVEKLNQLL